MQKTHTERDVRNMILVVLLRAHAATGGRLKNVAIVVVFVAIHGRSPAGLVRFGHITSLWYM